MSRRIAAQLPDSLLNVLRTGSTALLVTLGEDGFPNTAFTWVLAVTATTIRFGADHGSATLSNLEREGRASLQIIGEGNLIFLIKGTTRQIKPQIEAAPFKIAMLAMEVAMVKDQSWPGVNIHHLRYEWSPEQRQEMLAMERAVYAEMREWQV
ncbi:MAG TPA: pyridoxamine 5'-phosphate oxidase family protein [Anaerolineae bacterium]|jgi:hypothetical protein